MPYESTHTHRGKWSQPGVPHRGWQCVDVEDLGSPSQTCEMCEEQEVRYVHHMQHANYPGMLAVGCVCAEHMEEDQIRPRLREERLKRAARRRKSWGARVWNLSERGNFYLNTDGYNLTVVREGPLYKVRVTNRTTGASRLGVRTHETFDAAQRNALDALLWAKDHL